MLTHTAHQGARGAHLITCRVCHRVTLALGEEDGVKQVPRLGGRGEMGGKGRVKEEKWDRVEKRGRWGWSAEGREREGEDGGDSPHSR